MELKIFIYLIAITSILQTLAAHLCANFHGASRLYYSYLRSIAGIGGLVTYALFIWACFLTTWWIPPVAYMVAWVIKTLIPPFFKLEFIASILFPLALSASIVFLILGK